MEVKYYYTQNIKVQGFIIMEIREITFYLTMFVSPENCNAFCLKTRKVWLYFGQDCIQPEFILEVNLNSSCYVKWVG